MSKINLEKEERTCSLFGYKIGKLEKDEGKQEVPILTKNGVRDGTLHITQLSNGMYMNQVVIYGYNANISFTEWVLGNMRFHYNNYDGIINLCGMPSYRLSVKKDREFIGFGLFDFTGGGSNKTEEEKEFCALADCGFYIQHSLGNQKEELLFSNMEKDANHPKTSYAHLHQGKGINVSSKNHREDIETIAKNDINAMAFFEKIKNRLNEIFPEAGDVFSLLISDEEIKKYGLSIYLEPQRNKTLKNGVRQKTKN